jgi:hypothetical protein
MNRQEQANLHEKIKSTASGWSDQIAASAGRACSSSTEIKPTPRGTGKLRWVSAKGQAISGH